MLYYHGTDDPAAVESIAAGIRGRLYVTQSLSRATEYAAREQDFQDAMEELIPMHLGESLDAIEAMAEEICYSRGGVVIVLDVDPRAIKEDRPRMCEGDMGDMYLPEGVEFSIVGVIPAIEAYHKIKGGDKRD